MEVGIKPPPGAPTTISTRPPFRTTVGEIVLVRVRQPEREGLPRLSGVKKNPESFRKKPKTLAPDPNTELFV